MKTDTRNKAEKFWDRTAGNYNQEEKRDAKTLHLLVQRSKSYLNPTDTVLDFGCATGLASVALSESVQAIHAIDFSSKMIEIAKATAQQSNIDYIHATIFDERLQPGSYDAIVGFYILHLVDDPTAALTRIHSLLKPDGLFISATPCMGGKPLLSGIFSLFSKIGIVPRIHPFKIADLERLLTIERFEITENQLLPGTSNQYFMVAKKAGGG